MRAAGHICDPSPFGRCRPRTATKLPLCDDRSRLDAWAALSVAQRQEARALKFASTELHEKATRRVAADFLQNLIKVVPYKVHTVLTENGTHFTDPADDSWTAADIKKKIERKELFWALSFVVACARNDIEHRLTKPKHLWTNDQVERMNRTIKDRHGSSVSTTRLTPSSAATCLRIR